MKLHVLRKVGSDRYEISPSNSSLLERARKSIQDHALQLQARSEGFYGVPAIFICSFGQISGTHEDRRPSMLEFGIVEFPGDGQFAELSNLLAAKRPDLTEIKLKELWKSSAAAVPDIEKPPKSTAEHPPGKSGHTWLILLTLMLAALACYCLLLRKENAALVSRLEREQSERSAVGSALMENQGNLADFRAQIDKLQRNLSVAEASLKKTAESLQKTTDERDQWKVKYDQLKNERDRKKGFF